MRTQSPFGCASHVSGYPLGMAKHTILRALIAAVASAALVLTGAGSCGPGGAGGGTSEQSGDPDGTPG